MNSLNPIYTEKRECQDCYKCVRHCPVKAIKVEGGYASVMPELCILCGQCVRVCPNGAKRVRDDLPAARALLASRPRVLVSLAPSYVSEFTDIRPGQLIHALRQLGFAGVSETALGAQQVSAQAAGLLHDHPDRVLISSACPSVVLHFQRHRPQMMPHLTGLLSPLLTHCMMLRRGENPNAGIVFIGPCIAKKIEAAQHPELLNVALTFEDLRRWLHEEGIALESLTETTDDRFTPEAAAEGTWYPVDGGMIAGMKSSCAVNDGVCMAFSGIGAIEKAVDDLDGFVPENGLFLELLACEGGCVNGPRTRKPSGTVAKRQRILRQHTRQDTPLPRTPQIRSVTNFAVTSPPTRTYAEAELREALRLVGKESRDDELNCGGCGYESCREFAAALINLKAERAMCVTYMRKLALKKANALIQKIPSAVVIVDDAMRIIEHNAAFAEMTAKGESHALANVEGVLLSELLPFASLFQSVLKSGEDIPDRDLRYQNSVLNAAIFSIEKHRVVGGILQDITQPAVRKEQVIRKASEVIQKNLETVQKIAYLLGENAAESEVTLNSIIESFTPPKPAEPGEDHDWRKLYRR